MKVQDKSHIDRSYEQLIERFTGWAQTRSDIRAAIIVGSRARIDHSADEWADLDVLVITTDPDRYLSSTDWLENIGRPLLTFLEPTASGDGMERRVLFDTMLDVDFAITPKSAAIQFFQEKITPQSTIEIFNTFSRGYRVLLDKDGLTTPLKTIVSSIQTPTPQPPSEHEFSEVINDFLYHAVFTAKHLRRGELWWAKMCCDCYMQSLMLRIIEWHSQATQGWDYDTWFRGRYLEEWADPRVLKGLADAFAHYNEDDVGRALLAAMDLFRWIAIETAKELKYQYPVHANNVIKNWIKNCLAKN
ncbi:MAG: aminoglycoside 6-adenylyltransferase [Promethearchaeota archaeon]